MLGLVSTTLVLVLANLGCFDQVRVGFARFRSVVASLYVLYLLSDDRFAMQDLGPFWESALRKLYWGSTGGVGNSGPRSEGGSPRIRPEAASQRSDLDEHLGRRRHSMLNFGSVKQGRLHLFGSSIELWETGSGQISGDAPVGRRAHCFLPPLRAPNGVGPLDGPKLGPFCRPSGRSVSRCRRPCASACVSLAPALHSVVLEDVASFSSFPPIQRFDAARESPRPQEPHFDACFGVWGGPPGIPQDILISENYCSWDFASHDF